MKNLKKFSVFLLKRPYIIVALITTFAFIFRIFQVGKIQSQIFDEVYFVSFAKNYLNGVSFFDIHPPLGKLIIALGIKIFGDTPFGWRIMTVFFGTALIPLMYLTGKELGGRVAGIFTALVVVLDGMILVYSRLGLMDIFLSFFIITSFLFFLKFSKNFKFSNLILSGIFMALAASVKYNGFLLLFVFLVIGIIKKFPLKKYLFDYFLCLLILPLAIYLGFFFFNFRGVDFLQQVYNWHWQSLNYNFHLTESHPYGSKWWTWFLLLRPIWLYFQSEGNTYIGVVGMGNPLGWWSSVAIIPMLIWSTFKKEKTSIIILSAFLIFLLPWAFVKRVIFIYHAIPSFLFLSLGIGWYLEKSLADRQGRWLVGLYFLVLTFFYFYFLPIWMGFPTSTDSFYHRIWLKGWI